MAIKLSIIGSKMFDKDPSTNIAIPKLPKEIKGLEQAATDVYNFDMMSNYFSDYWKRLGCYG